MSEAAALPDDLSQPLDGEPRARVLVAGASGYAGALCARLAWRHPELELVAATSRSDAGVRLDSIYPQHGVPLELCELDLDRIRSLDAALVAYPHGAAAPLVAELRDRGALVVDLSADLRLRDLATYHRWYGEHAAPDLIEEAVYGLTELARPRLREAVVVANPGCYPTAALLALAPLAEAGICGDVVVDAKSGFSGAGRGGADAAAVAENTWAYAVAGHRHGPELQQELTALGAEGALTFVPHMLPVFQGLLASCYVTPTREVDGDELAAIYEARYAGEPFVTVAGAPPGIRDVRDLNDARIHVALNEGSGRIVALCAIDNLWKGAAGQAIQNLNLMLGLDETAGLR